MKYFNYKLILLLFIVPLNNVKASSTIAIECPSKGTPGSTITCKLSGTSDKEISSLSAKITVSDNMEFINFNTNSIWQGNGNEGSVDLYTDINKTDVFAIGTVTLKIKNNSTSTNGTIFINDIVYYDDEFKGIYIANNSKNIKITSTNNNLANLSLIGHNITPKFDTNITEYIATVDSDKVTIEASSEDKSATISGIGTKTLSYGKNTFYITVTSEAGTKKEYKLIITRPETKKEESNKEEQKEENKNTVNNQTTNEENKTEKKSNDSKLKYLNIDEYKINFNSNVYEYNIDISNEINKLNLETVANNEKANITITGNENLTYGKNKIIITVTAEDGSNSNYIIYATKKNNICVIENINISNYDLKFDCEIFEYELEIGFEEKLDIKVETQIDSSKINIYNNSNLKHGDIIKIVVNSEGVKYKYNIKILKNNFELRELFSDKQLIYIGTILVISSIYIIIRIILNNKKTKNIQ